MYAVHVSIKVQNQLAKKAIILSLKDWSDHLFQKENGLIFDQILECVKNGNPDSLQVDSQLLDQASQSRSLEFL